MAGAAAAVSSLTCAPAPCGLFPASSCGASRLQHSPLLELNWTGLLAVRSAVRSLLAPHTQDLEIGTAPKSNTVQNQFIKTSFDC